MVRRLILAKNQINSVSPRVIFTGRGTGSKPGFDNGTDSRSSRILQDTLPYDIPGLSID